MTAQSWLAIATFALSFATVFVGIVLWIHGKGKEAATLDHRYALIEMSVASLTHRMDVAGQETSRLATFVQGLPDTLRREMAIQYESIDVTKLLWNQNDKDHVEFASQIKTLWSKAELPSRRARD